MHEDPLHTIELPWQQRGWLEQVSDWIHACLVQHGWHATGRVEILHRRPWSAFARQSTDNGIVYFKAPAPADAYEAALTRSLARWRPDCTVPLLGVDMDRGWLLSADAGITLRSLTRARDQLEHWHAILPLYSQLQIEMAPRLPELLALGLPDRRLEGFPQQFATLLEDTGSLLLGQESGLTAEEYERLRDLRPRVTQLCQQLDAYGLPETLAHEEVHENNVIYGDGRYTFTDWSDCSVAHPFFSMTVTIRALAHWLQLDEKGPEIQRARDLYLEPWTACAPRADLLQALQIGYCLGMINRAHSWHHTLAHLSEEEKADYADSVPGWLQDFLQAESALP